MLLGCVPSHALYFTVYEEAKERLGCNRPGHHPAAAAGSGAMATIVHDAVMTPLDVVKQRLQLGFHAGLRDCLRTAIEREGLRGLYVSYPTTLFMNVPYGGIVVGCNESLKQILNPDGGNNLFAFLAAGSISGAVAAAATNPLDVAKTRLQTQACTLDSASVEPRPVEPRPNGPGRPAEGGARAARGSAAGAGGGAGGSAASGRPTAKVVHPVAAVHTSTAPRGTPAAAGSTSGGNASGTREMSSDKSALRRARMSALKTDPSSGCSNPRCEAPVPRVRGLVGALRAIYAEEGLRGFARGVRPRLMVHTPAMGISWATYETVKRFLSPPAPPVSAW
jgi:hypothetical protein